MSEPQPYFIVFRARVSGATPTEHWRQEIAHAAADALVQFQVRYVYEIDTGVFRILFLGPDLRINPSHDLKPGDRRSRSRWL